MIPKIIRPDSFDFGMPVVSLIGFSSKGLDKEALHKRAAEFDSELDKLEKKPGYEYIHLITTGAGEVYGCFFEGAPVTTATGIKPIEFVKTGDEVMTHKGRLRPVVETFSKVYEGNAARLKIAGLPEPVTSTANHPFRVVRAADIKRLRSDYYHRHHDREKMLAELDALPVEWSKAEDIRPGDYVLRPMYNDCAETLPEDLAYVLGAYAAEGCLAKRYGEGRDSTNYKKVIFVLPAEDKSCLIDRLDELCEKTDHKMYKKEYTTDYGKDMVRCAITWLDLVQTFEEYIGHGASTKFIHPVLLGQSREWKLKFLAGYLDGDGYINNTNKDNHKNSVRFSSVSRDLVYGIQLLAASCGICVSISRGCNKKRENSLVGDKDRLIYECSIGAVQALPVLEYTQRLKSDVTEDKCSNPKSIITANHMYCRVKEVVVYPLEEPTVIYNLEVEEDNSYVVDIEGHNSNNNGDYFNKTATVVRPFLKQGMEIPTGGGLMEYHDKTFMENGAAYKNHNNRHKGGKPSGYIAKAAYNKTMERGELIVGVKRDEWEKELQKIAEEKPVYFSMGCFTEDARVLKADQRLVSVADIRPGDKVITHTGKEAVVESCRVLEYHDAPYCRMRFSGTRELRCTVEHPYYMVPAAAVLDGNNRLKANIDIESAASWREAQELVPGDYALSPIDRREEAPDYLSMEFARLCGYYLSEGYLIKKDGKTVGIRLCLNEEDPILADLEDLAVALQLKRFFRVTYTPDKHYAAATLYDSRLASQINLLFGTGAHTKYIAEEVMLWPEKYQLQLLAGYFDGDGCFYTSDHTCVHVVRGSSTISSCNFELLTQIQRIAARWGYTPAMAKVDSKEHVQNGRVIPNTTHYILNMGIPFSNAVAPYAKRIEYVPPKGNYGRKDRLIIDDWLLVRLKKTEVEEGDITVYNMEVDHEDHSYLVNNLAVHNCDVSYDICSACGNKATKLSEYCDHLRNDMLSLSKEGHQVYAVNDKPIFHDISAVFKPADKIAFALRKVASTGRVISGAELAAMEGLTPRVDIIRKYAGERPSRRYELLRKLATIEKKVTAMSDGFADDASVLPFIGRDGHINEFNDDSVDVLHREDPGALFGALKDKVIIMPAETFFRVLTGSRFHEVQPHMCGMKARLPGIFQKLLQSDDLAGILGDGSYEPSGLRGGPGLKGEISRLVGSHSLAPEPVRHRVIRITISGVPKVQGFGVMPKQASVYDPAADFLAREYAKYVISFADGLPLAQQHLTVAQTVANSI